EDRVPNTDRPDVLRQLAHRSAIVNDVLRSCAMRTSLCWVAIAFVLGAGCKGDKAPPPAPGSGGSGLAPGSATAPASAAAAAPGAVELFVNDAALGPIQPAQIAAWTRLDSLVPGDVRKLGTWQKVALA